MFVVNRKIIIGLVILAVAVIIAANFWFRGPEISPRSSLDSGGPVIPEDRGDHGANKPSPFAGKSSNEIPRYFGRPLGEVRFGPGFSAPEEAIEKKRGDLKVLAAVLNANPMGEGGVDDWIAVGVIKKFFNDYVGSRDAWEYAGVLYPNNGLSFANLGNLYGFYLNDNAKAEFNFKKAIANDPYQPSYYIGLADFYKTVYVSKKSEASNVLLEGLDLIRDINLVLSLAAYYRDVGDKTNALKYYEEVLKMAPEQAGVREEIERLK